MTENEVKDRLGKLKDEISRLRFAYHVDNSPNVTDDVYESLTRELKNLEEKYPQFADVNSGIHRVAGEPLDVFKKVKHDLRMTSLNDAFSKEEVLDWEKRIRKLITNDYTYFAELKMDGLAVSLIYDNGVFVRGSTRGDGFIGENITENLKMINSIPLKLSSKAPSFLEVRGEVVMPKRALSRINKERIENNETPFANTRNAAAGSLRQLDPSVVKDRHLDFFAWDVAQYHNINIDTHSEKHQFLKDLGFTLAPYEKKSKSIDDVFAFIDEVEKIRPDFPYGTDGIVVTVDQNNLQEILGIVGKAPRYSVAFKYPAEKSTTQVLGITVNVGRTGVLTPLAHFVPTLVAGSTVSKATLHNMDQIERLDIRIGDTVVIQKAGDVIPEVVEVLVGMRTGKEKKFKMPDICPVCNADVEQRETESRKSPRGDGLAERAREGDPRTSMRGAFSAEGKTSQNSKNFSALPLSGSDADKNFYNSAASTSVAFYCTNKKCPAKNQRAMQHFVNAYEIYEIGPKILDRLKEEGLISDAADLFALEKADLSGLERFGEKSADNIISSIESHKKVELWRFIYALGILHVGEQTSHDIADHFESLEKIRKASLEEINNIENIGPVVSESIYNYFTHSENILFIEKLFANGVVIEKAKKTADSKWKGMTFVLTGTLSTMGRDDVKKKILANGGKVSSSVSAKTSYVVAGESAGSKYTEAQKLGVKILSEDEFLKIL
ncbi:MAG: NAD-dependent DNA ligase LigA [Candidatus Nomurabacteria bacterium]|nr:NAD-dependent DNA ligase LigA [Candidatus Nomurabacteria bacterium]